MSIPSESRPKRASGRSDPTQGLIERAQDGSLNAKNHLFERYYDRLRSVIRRRMSLRMRRYLESDDILQEAFAEAARGFDRFEPRGDNSLINWLAKIAERRIIAASRYHAASCRDRDREVGFERPESDSDDGAFEPLSESPPPGELVAEAELADMVDDAIDELSPDHQQVILLRDYCGVSYAAIAERMNRSNADAARMLRRRAVEALAARMLTGPLR